MGYLQNVLTLFLFEFVVSHGSNPKIVPDLKDYNPLKDEGFEPDGDWAFFKTKDDISIGICDFTNGQECKRTLVFMGEDTILDRAHTHCNSLSPMLGFVHFYRIIWYYGFAFLKKTAGNEDVGSNVDRFSVVIRKDENSCVQRSYTLALCTDCNSYSYDVTSVSKWITVDKASDSHCKDLINLNMPPMLLMSTRGYVGEFIPSSEWTKYNPTEPVGAMTRTYEQGVNCFQLLVLTSYGRPLDSYKMICGPIQGLVMSEKALHFGKSVIAKSGSDTNSFTVYLNPIGRCLKRKFAFVNNNGRMERKKVSAELEYTLSTECKALFEGKIADGTVSESQITALLEQFSNMPPNDIATKLSGYSTACKHYDFNLAKDLGIIIQYYNKGDTLVKAIVVVARGNIIDATVTGDSPTKNLVMRDNLICHDKDIMVKKEEKGNKIMVVINDGNGCTKRSHTLDEQYKKISSNEEKLTVSDQECKDLMVGNSFKNPEAEKYGGMTHSIETSTTFDGDIETIYN